MTHALQLVMVLGLSFAVSLQTSGGAAGQADSRGNPAAPPRFADPERPRKLAAAFPEIDRLYDEFAARVHAPGLAYGILIDGELVHTHSIGNRDLAANAPVDNDTVFRIASMTKSFTALSILKLRDEGKLSLDDLAERYVPELATLSYPTTDSPRITVRHLLNHAQGFPEDNPWGDRQLATTDQQFSEMIGRGIPFSNAPGLAYEYSNFGFAILGRIVALVSQMTYRDYVAANILRPLGMTATRLDPADVPAARLAHGYRWEDGTWKEEPLLADGAFGAMGGMLTSLHDLSRYVAFMMAAWPPRNDKDDGPVRRASVREMQQAWRTAPTVVTRDPASTVIGVNAGGYGFGLRVSQTCNFEHVVGHTGGLPGFGSSMRWLPDYGVGIVSLVNLTYASAAAVADPALDALARTGALRPRIPQPSPALVDARDLVSQLITRWDDRLADQIAADNLFLDTAKERRRRQLDELLSKSGACRPDGALDVENALRGAWTMKCDRGALRVSITLAPTMPPRVQFLSIRPFTPSAEGARDLCGQ
jgi:CubicO group peptidase (beta-lactamase class C family)